MSTATTHRYDTSRYRAPAGLTEHSPALLRFTIANPPINLFDPDVYAELRRLVDRMQADPELRVDLLQSFRAISDAISWPTGQARIHVMEERGWGADTDTELNHAALVGELASELAHAANHRAAPAEGGRR